MGFLRLIDRFLHPDDAIAPAMPNELEARQNAATTIVSVIYQTAAKTFDGPAVYVTQTAGPALQQPATTTQRSAATTTTQRSAATTTQKAQTQQTTEQPTQQSTSEDASETEVSTDESATSTAIATAAVATTAISSSSASSTSSPVKSISSIVSTRTTASSASSQTSASAGAASTSANPDGTTPSGGMSGGAKAGLALGLLLACGALLGLILCFYRRKKKTVSHHKIPDSEKGALGYNSSESGGGRTDTSMGVASVRTTRTHETAPRLSLRPVTQFLPGFGAGDRRSAIKQNNHSDNRPDMANHSHARGMLAPASQPATSAWEKRGVQNNAGNPNNPFGNHAEITDPSVPQTAQAQPPAAPPVQERAASPESPEITPEAFPVPRSQAHAAGVPLPDSTSATPKRMSIKSDISSAAPTGPSEIPSALVPGAAAGAAGAAGAVAGAAMGTQPRAATVPVPVGANNVYRVQLAFKPTMDDEIELRAGAVVRMLHEYDDGWALCIRMDRAQQGVAPRTCLSKQPVKPSPRIPPPPRGAPPPHLRGPPMGPPRGPPRGPPGHMSGRSSPYGPRSGPASGHSTPSRPMSPGMQPSSPYGNRAFNPESPRSPPQGRGRSHSNAAPYQHFAGQNRSMSPGPYGQGQLRPHPRNQQPRPRSNSMGNLGPSRTPPAQSRIPVPAGAVPARKPVPGMAL